VIHYLSLTALILNARGECNVEPVCHGVDGRSAGENGRLSCSSQGKAMIECVGFNLPSTHITVSAMKGKIEKGKF